MFVSLLRPVKLFLARYEQLKIASQELSKKKTKTKIYIDSSGKFMKKFKGFYLIITALLFNNVKPRYRNSVEYCYGVEA